MSSAAASWLFAIRPVRRLVSTVLSRRNLIQHHVNTMTQLLLGQLLLLITQLEMDICQAHRGIQQPHTSTQQRLLPSPP